MLEYQLVIGANMTKVLLSHPDCHTVVNNELGQLTTCG